MHKWVIETSDGIYVVGASHKPKRSDYLKVLPCPEDYGLDEGPTLSIVGDVVTQNSAAKAAMDSGKLAFRAARDVAKINKQNALEELKALKISDLRDDNDIKSTLLKIIDLL